RDDLGFAADGHDHHLVGRTQRLDERAGRRLHQRQSIPLAGHAEAAIDADRDRQRKLAGGERRDRLRLAVFEHAKIADLEISDWLAETIGDGRVHLDQADAARKLCINQRATEDQWYNPRDSRSRKSLEHHMFGSLGLPELVIILIIVVLIFGANRLPQLAKGLGSSVKNFKEGMKEGESGSPNQKS